MDTSQLIETAQPIEYWVQLSDRWERSGNYLGACDAALLGLEQHSEARQLQYRAILNLSRAGANKRALQLWLQYRLRPNLDNPSLTGDLEENIAALNARLVREEAYAGDVPQRSAGLSKAAQLYESIYLRTANTFPGLNAAVLNEMVGATARAKEIAERILKECEKADPQSKVDTYQLAADRAAANLLLGNLKDAQAAIERAAAFSDNAAAIASTRKQLTQICDHKGIDRAIISALNNRTVIHYTGHMIAPEGTPGRFPAQAEAHVAERIQRELANYNVGYGYGSLACGADTLIVEALLARQAEVGVVLPFETDSFVKKSVTNGGAKWLGRFNECLKQVTVIAATEGEHVEDPEVFAYASQLAMGLAILRAQQLSSEVIQVAVWDGRESTDRAGTFADIRVWRGHDLKTVTISSEGNVTANITKAEQEQQPSHQVPPRKVRAIMFGDFHGFSRLTDGQMLTFYDQVMLRVASVLDKYANHIAARNTWGDGIFIVLSDLDSAARCALELQSELAKLDLHSFGLPASLGLRLGLDAGAIFEIRDPILKSASFTGSHVNRTARLEPATPPGAVYVTEAFAALFALLRQSDCTCEYVGMMQAPKGYGRLRTYLLRHRAAISFPQPGTR